MTFSRLNRELSTLLRDAMRLRRPLPAAAVLLLMLAAAGCAQLPPQLPHYGVLPMTQRPSPNFGERRPNFVILHHTGSASAEHALATLTDPASKVSSHYLVARDGVIYYLVDERLRAWHAGASYWGGSRDLNSASIGIELDNNGDEPFPEAQMAALLALLADLKARYQIPAENFLGHADVAPGRKVDPGRQFPWRRLAQHGYGLWCEPPHAPAPPGADGVTLLAALGYDTSRPDAALAAFRLRYAPQAAAEVSAEELALMHCLLEQMRQR